MHLKSIRPGTMLGVFLAALLGILSIQAQAVTLKQIKQRGYVRIAVVNEIPYGYMNIEGKAVDAGITCSSRPTVEAKYPLAQKC
jgi:hypothetical protein